MTILCILNQLTKRSNLIRFTNIPKGLNIGRMTIMQRFSWLNKHSV